MAGIYIHIPYCRTACHYCNFHFSTQLSSIPDYIEALCEEISIRKTEVEPDIISSIYLGGGTPSVLSVKQIIQIFDALEKKFDLTSLQECTIEMNPEDVNTEYMHLLKNFTPIDRISLGLQSLEDKHLIWMNRKHTALEGLRAVDICRDSGFENISIDLIFGYEMLTKSFWTQELEEVIALEVPHISHYGLTIEPKTYFAHLESKGVSLTDEDRIPEQMVLLYTLLEEAGYHNYELSNSAKAGFEAVHNSGYWKGSPYIAYGAAAHGFDGGSTRYLNIENTPKYIKSLAQGKIPQEVEVLSEQDRYHEYLMLNLRQDKGLGWSEFETLFSIEKRKHIEKKCTQLDPEWYILSDESLRLTYTGWVWSDFIFRELFD